MLGVVPESADSFGVTPNLRSLPRFAALIALLMTGCIGEPGFMSTVPHWRDDEPRPIEICLEAHVGEPDTAQVSRVIRTMNDRLGFKLYALATTPGVCTVFLTLGVPSEPGWIDPGGNATIYSDRTDGLRCSAQTSNTGTLELTFDTIEHELGHCVGLAHDDWNGSIMRRVQTPTPDGEFGPWIDDHDRALLRETYAPPRAR